MSRIALFRLFADYNRLMNRRQFEAASRVTANDLRRDCGAFFSSLLGTLNHNLVGDIIWLKRFSGYPPGAEVLAALENVDRPAALDSILFEDLDQLTAQRVRYDALIIDWIDALDEPDLDGCLAYDNMAGQAQHKPIASLIAHLFLHQVHHRGQATTLLSQFGIDFGETDLLEIIPDCTALAADVAS